MAPLTALTRFGIRSWRRLSCTSICLKALTVWFFSEMSPLYALTIQRPTMTTSPSSTHMIIVSCNGRGAACCARTDVLRAVWQEFRDRLADGLRQPLVVGAEPGERVVGIDVQLHAARHRDAAPGRRAAGFLVGVARQPRGERTAGATARHPLGAFQRQPVGRRQRGAEDTGAPPLQDVPRLVVHVFGNRGERRALHLPQLDREQLEEVAVGGR